MNQHGVIRKEIDYTAFGNGSESNFDDALHGYTGAVDRLFRFTGRYLDEDTGLQNNLHRWYDPKIGRWLSQDPIGFAGGDANLYRYVGNEPTGKRDPSGLEGEDQPILLYPAAPPRAATDPFGDPTMWEMVKDSVNVREMYFDMAGYRRKLVDGKWYWASDDCSHSVVDEWRDDADRIPFSPVPVAPISLASEGDVVGAGKSFVTDYATDRLVGAAGMIFARLPNGTFRVIDRLDDDAADFARRNGGRGGPYGHLDDRPSANSGKPFTSSQKKKILAENEARNGGQIIDDCTGKPLVKPEQHTRGVRPPDNEAQIDHVYPRSRGGPNTFSNVEVRSRIDNIEKGDKLE